MGRWGWEGNKAVSWEYFRLLLSFISQRSPKKKKKKHQILCFLCLLSALSNPQSILNFNRSQLSLVFFLFCVFHFKKGAARVETPQNLIFLPDCDSQTIWGECEGWMAISKGGGSLREPVAFH